MNNNKYNLPFGCCSADKNDFYYYSGLSLNNLSYPVKFYSYSGLENSQNTENSEDTKIIK